MNILAHDEDLTQPERATGEAWRTISVATPRPRTGGTVSSPMWPPATRGAARPLGR